MLHVNYNYNDVSIFLSSGNEANNSTVIDVDNEETDKGSSSSCC